MGLFGNTEVSRQSSAGWDSDAKEQRRELSRHLPRRPEFENFVEESNGYAFLPVGTFAAVPSVVTFCRQALAEKRQEIIERNKKKDAYRADVLRPRTYEEAPPIFDLALSDEVLQIATDYLGEVPLLMSPRLWWTRTQAPDAEHKRTQLYHRGRPKVVQERQAKFLFAINDIDEAAGPFILLAADISEEIARTIGYVMGEQVSDEAIYAHVSPTETKKFVGPAGTGLFVDTCRCFHYGARARDKERLMLMFQFLRPGEAPGEERFERSPAFYEKFGDDPVRNLVVPA